jgi:hypothetical protein
MSAHDLDIVCNRAAGSVCAVRSVERLDKGFEEFQKVWKTADKNGALKLISEDVTWFSVKGRSLTKPEVIETLTRRGGMDTVSDKNVRLCGNIALITFGDGGARRTIAWNRTNDGWKVVRFIRQPHNNRFVRRDICRSGRH